MDRERLAWLRLAVLAVDAVALSVGWVAIVCLRYAVHTTWALDSLLTGEPLLRPMSLEYHLWLGLLVVPTWLLVLRSRGSYRYLRRKRLQDVAAVVVIASAIATFSVFAGLYLLRITEVSRLAVMGFGVAAVPTLIGVRVTTLALMRRLRRRRFDVHRVLLVGRAEDAAPFLDTIAGHPEWGIEIVGVLGEAGLGVPRLGSVSDLNLVLDGQPVDEVYLTRHDLESSTLVEVARSCEEIGVRFSMDANFLGLGTARVELQSFEGVPVLSFGTTPSAGFALAAKRALDIVGSASGLVLLAPFLLLISLGIKLSDGGPVLFRQERAGRFGRTFSMWKFRTMVEDAESRLDALREQNELEGPAFKMSRDPRVTPLGRVLRRTSLDELPQLWNVLRGQMSLVGPRPPLLSEVAEYERWQLRRLSMRPGLTCLWQVSGRSDVTDFEEWMQLDLEYIDRWSLLLDVRLILETVPAVLRGTGAR